MMTRRTFSLAALAATATSILTPAAAQQSSDLFHIDDLSGAPGSSYGGRWQLSTDRVMGGVSRGSARLIQENGQNIIEMTGDVSTANNGGFVQVSKSLRPRLDASDYTGVELVVQGDGHLIGCTYAIVIRHGLGRYTTRPTRQVGNGNLFVFPSHNSAHTTKPDDSLIHRV